jgi:hypothetical protein
LSAPALRVEDVISDTNASPLWVGVSLGSRFGERLAVNVTAAAAFAECESGDGFRDGRDRESGSLSSGGPSSVLRAILVGVLITTTSVTSSLPSFSNSDASVNSERSPSPPTAATFLPRAGDRGDHAEATRVARLPGMFRGSPDWSMLGRAGELFGFGGGRVLRVVREGNGRPAARLRPRARPRAMPGATARRFAGRFVIRDA